MGVQMHSNALFSLSRNLFWVCMPEIVSVRKRFTFQLCRVLPISETVYAVDLKKGVVVATRTLGVASKVYV